VSKEGYTFGLYNHLFGSAEINTKDWEYLISFRPSHDVQRSLKIKFQPARIVHRIEDAYGPINLDFYPVTVTSLPVISGKRVTPEEFISFIRLHLNDTFIDTEFASVSPYDDVEAEKWKSSNPINAVIHWDMKTAGGWINPDDGSVVVSEFTSQYWIFSTIWTPDDLAHPVSGNRQFGFTSNNDGTYTFYTRGADRITDLTGHLAAARIVFGKGHQLWLSLQDKIATFVNRNSGGAKVEQNVSTREQWDRIKRDNHKPTTSWL
jgi:hypothetical protein